jgi:hypothetical protein
VVHGVLAFASSSTVPAAQGSHEALLPVAGSASKVPGSHGAQRRSDVAVAAASSKLPCPQGVGV